MGDAAMVGWWMVTVSPTDTDTTGWHGGAGVCQSRFWGLWHPRAQSIPQCQVFWKPITKEPDLSLLPELSRLWLWLGQALWAVLATPEQFHNFTWQLYKVKKKHKIVYPIQVQNLALTGKQDFLLVNFAFTNCYRKCALFTSSRKVPEPLTRFILLRNLMLYG